ncbi:MAG TPA: hypothetical protein VH331_14320 [Allosphingosinicella sp.]|nr:hypothetical protein [Allosphingosinicella sp.]
MALPLMLCLAACGHSAGEEAEKRYAMVERSNGTPDERCDQANKTAAAYLRDGNEAKYREWRLRSQVQCGPADDQL